MANLMEERRKILSNSPHKETINGKLVNFNTDMKAWLDNCVVHFSATQEGDGDPSSTNIRPINGCNGITLYKSNKNIGHVFGYSTANGQALENGRALSNTYGTTIDTISYELPDTELVITQTKYPDTSNVLSYQNGYFAIYMDNLIYNEFYDVSFKVTNITADPLNAIDKIRLLSPSGSNNGPTVINNNTYIYKNVQWKQNSTNPNRSNWEIRNCGASFTLSEFMVTPVGKNDGVFEPYIEEPCYIDLPNPSKNIIHIVHYSTSSMRSPNFNPSASSSYGTTINTTDFYLPDTPVVITQSKQKDPNNFGSYKNGYITVESDNLEFGRKYLVSFRVSNIVNNPLNASISDIKLGNPRGDNGQSVIDVIGDRVIFSYNHLQTDNYPYQRGISVYICGMSCTISEFMVTELDETDMSYEPYRGCYYGGYVDLLNGYMSKEWDLISSYNGEVLPDEWISDRDIYVANTTPTIGARIIYKLSTPTIYQLTPQLIKSIKGDNYLFSSENKLINIKYWNHKYIIPPQYQRVDYIQTLGHTAYFDTGVTGNDETLQIELECMLVGNGHYESFFGVYGNTINDSVKGWTLRLANTSSDTNVVAWQIKCGNTNSSYSVAPYGGGITHVNKHIKAIFTYGKGVMFGDRVVFYNLSDAASQNDENIFIGTTRLTSTNSQQSAARIWYFKMWSQGELIRDYIPCIRKSDGIAGFYDTVNRTFNPSTGSTQFIAGND